jgi:prepilin-type N-terminal cleavage/methylation domain-containing protein
MVIQKKTNQGFTLVELSIGIVVIGVLVSLALMGIGDSKNDAQGKKRSAIITAIETAKNRYILDSDGNVLNQPTLLEHIAPLLNVEGENVDSLFDLVQGTGKKENDLDLGTYGVRPANFEGEGENAVSSVGYDTLNDFLDAKGGTGMTPSQYQDLIDEGLITGEITRDDLDRWGLAPYFDQWLPQEEVTQLVGGDAQNIINNGGNWGDLTEDQQNALLQTNPGLAVDSGGSDALNKLDPSDLTPELVDGHVQINNTWRTPVLNSGNQTPWHDLPWARYPYPEEEQILQPSTTPIIPSNSLVVGYNPLGGTNTIGGMFPTATNNYNVSWSVVRYPADPLAEAEIVGTITTWRNQLTNAVTGAVTAGFPAIKMVINPGVQNINAAFLRKMTLYNRVDGVLVPQSQSVSRWNEVTTGETGGIIEDLTVDQSGPLGAISVWGDGTFGLVPPNN